MTLLAEYAQRHGDYDVISPALNFSQNAALVAVGGVSVGAIVYLAFKALGISGTAATAATAIPVTIGAFGIAAAIAGGCLTLYVAAQIGSALRRL